MENIIKDYRDIMNASSEEEAMRIFIKSYERENERRETLKKDYGFLDKVYQNWKKKLGE